jgi:hypothetical protein
MTSSRAFRALAVFLCVLMSLPALPQSPSGHPSPVIGTVTALVPGTTRNGGAAQAKQELYAGDVIRTDRSGRARITLRDGSVLSLGPETDLKLIQHDPQSQVTVLQLDNGRLRSRVVPVKQGGKFEVRMPDSVAHVMGTDFFLAAQPDGNMKLIVYSGRVWMAGSGKHAGESVTVDGNHMAELGQNGFSTPAVTPPSVQEDSIASTSTEGGPASTSAAAGANSNLLRNMLIGIGVAATGIAIAVTKGTANHSSNPAATAGKGGTPAGTSAPPQGQNPRR